MLKGVLARDDDVSLTDHNKFWQSIGFLAMTVVFTKIGWQATPTDSLAMLFLVYGAIVAGSRVAEKFFSMKWGGQAQQEAK